MRSLILLALCLFSFVSLAQDQITRGIIDLTGIYQKHMIGKAPDKKVIKSALAEYAGTQLEFTSEFIIECTKEKNKITSKKFLAKPDNISLKALYCIHVIYVARHNNESINEEEVVKSLFYSEIQSELLIDNFYNTAFTAVGNKNRPFNMSKDDFDFKALGLTSKEDRGIFFLQCMDGCASQIWGYMNIPKPANTKAAMGLIEKFPKFNGDAYYLHKDLSFDDFEVEINDSIQSYKSFYINKYYELLFNHFICQDAEGASNDDMMDLLMNSVLPIESYWQYTEFEDALRQIYSNAE